MRSINAWLIEPSLAWGPWESTLARISLILLLAWLMHLVLSRSNPRWRVLVWRLAAIAVLSMPCTVGLLPTMSLAILPPPTAEPIIEPIAPSPPRAASPAVDAATPLPVKNSVMNEPVQPRSEAKRQRTEETPTIAREATESDAIVALELPSISWQRIILLIWTAGLLINLLAELRSWSQLRALKRRSQPVAADVLALGKRVAEQLQCHSTFAVQQTDELKSPCVIGLLHPTILLPQEDCLPGHRSRLSAIFSHELAHIVGRDLLWNSAVRWLSRLLWFHPLAWRIQSAHLAACDAVCDATAANLVGDVAGYGRLLAQLALRYAQGDTRVALQMARPSSVRQRIEALHRRLYAASLSRTAVSASIFLGLLLTCICVSISIAREQTAVKNDLYGDSLPPGATLRLGTIRYRHAGLGGRSDLAILPDSTTAITNGDGSTLRLWDIRDGQKHRDIHMEGFYFERFVASPDGKLLAAAGWLNRRQARVYEIRIVDIDKGTVVQTLKRSHEHYNDPALTFTPDSKKLVSIGGFDDLVRIEEISSGEELLTQTIPADSGASLAISPDGKQIAIQTGANSKKLLVWDWQSGQEPRELPPIGSPRGHGEIKYSPDGQFIACIGYGYDPVHVWDAKTGTLRKQLMNLDEQESYNGTLIFSPDGKWLYTPTRRNAGEGRLYAWNTATWKLERTIAGSFGKIEITHDGRFLVQSEYSTSTVSVFDLVSQETLGPRDAHRQAANAIVTSQPDFIATASDDGSIRLWDPVTGRQTLTIQQAGWLRGFAMSPNGKYLLASSMGENVCLWELPSGKEVYRFKGHGQLGGVRTVAFSADGQKACSFGDDYILRVYDVRTGKLKHESRVCLPGEKCPVVDEEEKPANDRFPRMPFGTCFSANGDWLLIPVGNKLHLFNGFNGNWVKTIEINGTGQDLLSVFSPDAQKLLFAYYEKIADPRSDANGVTRTVKVIVAVLDVETGKAETKIEVPQDMAYSGCFSPDGKRFALSGWDPHRAIIYQLDGKVEAVISDVPRRIWKSAFTHDGRGLITALDDSSLLVWDLAEFAKPKP